MQCCRKVTTTKNENPSKPNANLVEGDNIIIVVITQVINGWFK